MNDVAAPKFSRARAALTVLVTSAATGVLIGALWSWLAPPVHGVVALTRDGDRVRAYLGDEGDHFFVAAFLLVGMLCVVAVVAAVLVWQWRAHRGPVMTAALATGCMLAAGVAAGLGALLVRLRYGTIDVAGAPVTPEHRVHYVVETPPVFFGHSPLQVALTVLFPAAVAALVYSFMAVSAARDDLGAWPPVTAESAPPSAPTSL
ncbi:DUF2567 domain-containing protein [Mycobacterium sp. E740]|uniref:DUF2567 domain-containing protein n=1 Tax=Mycobacterium sp. E740 TaxID=1834149 RepID=UPI0007FCD0CB|nr:DUF2567 domain-containing protein [Mycobacterium sp. E740]OBI84278.1 hypothetical protein A5663_11805 [Mycobacterium sp. E740]